MQSDTSTKDVIISPYAGGLGDNLCFSTLPEMYARTGFKVLIGRPMVEPNIRNLEVQQLVWEANPFVSGYTEEMGKTFSHREMHHWIWAQNETRTLVEAMEALHGFTPVHKYPKIYYEPNKRPDAKNEIFADPTSISQNITPEAFDEFARHICNARGYELSEIVVLSSKYSGKKGATALAGNRRYVVRDIFEYADLIFSCRLFITSESGGAILASAIRGEAKSPEIMTLFATNGMNDRLFQFPNVRYCVTGKVENDYFFHQKLQESI